MRVMKACDSASDAPLVCFCEVVARDPFFLIGSGDRPGFRLTDLARLRLATVSEVPTPWLCLQHDVRQKGIDPRRLERVADRTMADNIESLRRGELDVAQVFEPYASMALKSGLAISFTPRVRAGPRLIRHSWQPVAASSVTAPLLPRWCELFAACNLGSANMRRRSWPPSLRHSTRT
jgi:hypothetical protein